MLEFTNLVTFPLNVVFTPWQTFTWAELTGKTDALEKVGMDLTKKEQFLIPAEFTSKFAMSLADFNKLPGWKREALKKKIGIF